MSDVKSDRKYIWFVSEPIPETIQCNAIWGVASFVRLMVPKVKPLLVEFDIRWSYGSLHTPRMFEQVTILFHTKYSHVHALDGKRSLFSLRFKFLFALYI